MQPWEVNLTRPHQAVGGPRLFAIGIERPEPGCRIAAVVNEAVSEALQEAERLLVERLASISLAALDRTFDEWRGSVRD
jgi:hypothetical protein